MKNMVRSFGLLKDCHCSVLTAAEVLESLDWIVRSAQSGATIC